MRVCVCVRECVRACVLTVNDTIVRTSVGNDTTCRTDQHLKTFWYEGQSLFVNPLVVSKKPTKHTDFPPVLSNIT